ncbi:uncharacterized protein LOC126607280 [Malus sylvestris]|uniref:uncharacterized protein LOC126607280 n=1 Tax=Malus sylvestris TaxID=3752 RepID=UPI0021AC5634|nr:uncharacterized protein LOC126607280 [Malus sylvestris]
MLRAEFWESSKGGSRMRCRGRGREVLIKAVVQAIPAYPMCILKFPVVVCQELDALVAKFWWGSHGENRKIHWVSKEVLGLSKDRGGMGFRNFQEFNDVLLAKQCWRLITESNSLWAQVIKAQYFPHCSFWEAKNGAKASWAWSSLLSGRELIAIGSHWQIMGGEDVRVWVDRWLPLLPSGDPMPLGEVEVTKNLRVSSLIDSSSRQWDFEFLRPFLSMEDQRAIQETLIGDSMRKDRLVWATNRNGKYSVKSGYMWLQTRALDVRDHCLPVVRSIPKNLWTSIWKLEVPPKIRHFLWVSINPSKVIFALSTAFENFLHVASNLGVNRPVLGPREADSVRWCPFSSPFVKINVDASWSKCLRMGFVGVVARQEGGLFSGCGKAISCLNGSLENGSWKAFPILARAQRLGTAFQNCRWSWVPRSANMAANVLASAGLTEMRDIVWVDRPPSSLVHTKKGDLSIANYLDRMNAIADNLVLAGQPLHEAMVVALVEMDVEALRSIVVVPSTMAINEVLSLATTTINVVVRLPVVVTSAIPLENESNAKFVANLAILLLIVTSG